MEVNNAVAKTLESRDELEARWLKHTEEGHAAHDDKRYAFAELKFMAALQAAEKLTEGMKAATYANVDDNSSAELKQGRLDMERFTKSLNNLAAVYQLQGKYQLAETCYERCLDIKLDLYGEEHLDTAVNLHNLATLHCAKRRWEKADILYKRALEIREKILGTEDKQLVHLLKNYAVMLRKVEREEEATKMEERAQAIESKSANESKHAQTEKK